MTQLSDYYRARAAEYDAVYEKPERQDDLAKVRGLLAGLVHGNVLEIAAGTGYWTQTLAASATAVTATDISPEPLEVARSRQYGRAPVELTIADAYALHEIPGQFDMAFLGFFWSHVLRADLPRFLSGLHERLGPGTTVTVLDNRYVPGSSTPISRTARDGDTYQRRTLSDGREYEILKNFPEQSQFTEDVAAFGRDVEWTALRYFWLATFRLR